MSEHISTLHRGTGIKGQDAVQGDDFQAISRHLLSHSTASKSSILLWLRGLIVSLSLQAKLTLPFTFTHFISYGNGKALQVAEEELISKAV